MRLSSSNDNTIDILSNILADFGGHVESMLGRSLYTGVNQGRVGFETERQQAAHFRRVIDARIVQACSAKGARPSDIRRIIVMGHIASELENIADLIFTLDAPFETRCSEEMDQYFKALGSMKKLVKAQLTTALDALLILNSQKALQAWMSIADIQEMNMTLLKEHLTLISANIRGVNLGTHILHVSKTLEKIADCSKKIAQSVYEIATGKALPAHHTPRNVKPPTHEMVS